MNPLRLFFVLFVLAACMKRKRSSTSSGSSGSRTLKKKPLPLFGVVYERRYLNSLAEYTKKDILEYFTICAFLGLDGLENELEKVEKDLLPSILEKINFMHTITLDISECLNMDSDLSPQVFESISFDSITAETIPVLLYELSAKDEKYLFTEAINALGSEISLPIFKQCLDLICVSEVRTHFCTTLLESFQGYSIFFKTEFIHYAPKFKDIMFLPDYDINVLIGFLRKPYSAVAKYAGEKIINLVLSGYSLNATYQEELIDWMYETSDHRILKLVSVFGCYCNYKYHYFDLLENAIDNENEGVVRELYDCLPLETDSFIMKHSSIEFLSKIVDLFAGQSRQIAEALVVKDSSFWERNMNIICDKEYLWDHVFQSLPGVLEKKFVQSCEVIVDHFLTGKRKTFLANDAMCEALYCYGLDEKKEYFHKNLPTTSAPQLFLLNLIHDTKLFDLVIRDFSVIELIYSAEIFYYGYSARFLESILSQVDMEKFFEHFMLYQKNDIMRLFLYELPSYFLENKIKPEITIPFIYSEGEELFGFTDFDLGFEYGVNSCDILAEICVSDPQKLSDESIAKIFMGCSKEEASERRMTRVASLAHKTSAIICYTGLFPDLLDPEKLFKIAFDAENPEYYRFLLSQYAKPNIEYPEGNSKWPFVAEDWDLLSKEDLSSVVHDHLIQILQYILSDDARDRICAKMIRFLALSEFRLDREAIFYFASYGFEETIQAFVQNYKLDLRVFVKMFDFESDITFQEIEREMDSLSNDQLLYIFRSLLKKDYIFRSLDFLAIPSISNIKKLDPESLLEKNYLFDQNIFSILLEKNLIDEFDSFTKRCLLLRGMNEFLSAWPLEISFHPLAINQSHGKFEEIQKFYDTYGSEYALRLVYGMNLWESIDSFSEETRLTLQEELESFQPAAGDTKLEIPYSNVAIEERSYNVLNDLSISFWKSEFSFKVAVQGGLSFGIDSGGMTRDILSSVFDYSTKIIFKSHFYVFDPFAEQEPFFIGLLLGKMLSLGMGVNFRPCPAFYKQFKGAYWTDDNIAEIDPMFLKVLQNIEKNNLTEEDDLPFEINIKGHSIVLKENSLITNHNKLEFIWLAKQKFIELYSRPLRDILDGMLVTYPLLRLLTASELKLMLEPDSEIDLDDWENNSHVAESCAENQAVEWFWQYLEENHSSRKKILKFVHGTDIPPLGGFSNLQGHSGVQLFNITCDERPNLIPTTSTCFNTITLFEYQSYESFSHFMQMAIDNSQGFGMQ